MDTTVTGIGSVVVAELRAAGYLESTIGQYEKTIKALTCFAKERGGTYTPSLAAAFRVDDDQSAHWPSQCAAAFDYRRLVSVFDTYVSTGRVDLSCRKRGGGGTHPESCEFTALAAAWVVNMDGRDLARATRDAYGRVSRAYLGIAAFATVDMMREAVNAATPAINSQPRSGSPRTSSKPSTASDSASSLSRGISQATPPAQAWTRFLGLTQGSA